MRTREFDYKSVFEHCRDSIIVATVDGIIIAANPASCRMFRMTEAELRSSSRYDLYDLEQETIDILLAQRKLEGEILVSVTMKRKGGEKFPVEISSKVFRDSSGEEYSIKIIRDLTDRVKSEIALRESEAKFGIVIEKSGTPVMICSPEGYIVMANAKAASYIGKKPEELTGKNALDLFRSKAESNFKKILKQSLSSPGTVEVEVFVPLPSGDFWFLSNFTRMTNNVGEVTGTMIISQDITERKSIESALQKKEANLRSLIENTDKSIWSIDNKFRLIDCNLNYKKRFEAVLGYMPVIGDNIIDPMPSVVKKEWKGYFKKCLTGKSFSLQAKALPPLAAEIFRYSFNPIYLNNNEIIGVTVIGENITDLIRSSEMLIKSTEKLHALNLRLRDAAESERQKIAFDLHDDLGQKLTALSLSISWLKSRTGVQSEVVEEKFSEVSKLLTETIDSVRRISRGLRPGILDNLGLLPTIEWQLDEFTKTTGIQSEYSCPHEELHISNDMALSLYRIIQEALTNITRHSGATKVFVCLKNIKGSIVLSVRDNGKGIEKKNIESGASFGLMVMKERAGMHNGTLRIDGRSGRGTTIKVTIPCEVNIKI